MLTFRETRTIFRFWLANLGHYYIAHESKTSSCVKAQHRQAIDRIIQAIDSNTSLPTFRQDVGETQF